MAIATSVAFADVRVDITRDLPYKSQNIVQVFDDIDAFQMWFEMKMEQGCDPYVTSINIDMNYNQ